MDLGILDKTKDAESKRSQEIMIQLLELPDLTNQMRMSYPESYYNESRVKQRDDVVPHDVNAYYRNKEPYIHN